MPAHILYNSFMFFEFANRLNLLRAKHTFLADIPNVNCWVICSREQKSFLLLVPRKSISFFLMSRQFQLGLNFICFWSCRMFKIVENVNFSWDSFSSYNVSLLRHWSSSVHFSIVIDFSLHFNSLSFSTESMSICIIVMILWGLYWCIFKRNLHFHDLEIVLLVFWSVSSYQQFLNGAIWVWRAIVRN